MPSSHVFEPKASSCGEFQRTDTFVEGNIHDAVNARRNKGCGARQRRPERYGVGAACVRQGVTLAIEGTKSHL